MKSKVKITSMNKLRKEKARLALQIEQDKVEILGETEKFAQALWPFKILRKFRKTADSLSENKLIVIAAQVAYSFFNATKNKADHKKAHDKESGVLSFLKDVAKNFVEMYTSKQEDEDADSERKE